MKTETKVYLITSVIFMAIFLAIFGIIWASAKSPYKKMFDRGTTSEWANEILKDSCEQINSIIGDNSKKLNYKRIKIRISNEQNPSRFAESLNNSILINESFYGVPFDSDETLFKGILNHELIHVFIEKFYHEEFENHNSHNHTGKFSEIETLLRNNGVPLYSNYVKKHY